MKNWTKGNVGWRRGRVAIAVGVVGRSKKRVKQPIAGNPLMGDCQFAVTENCSVERRNWDSILSGIEQSAKNGLVFVVLSAPDVEGVNLVQITP